jgi:hypothetical protein
MSKDPDFIGTPQFMTLSLELKQRWWDETDYGRKPPTDELKQAILAAVEKPQPPSSSTTSEAPSE